MESKKFRFLKKLIDLTFYLTLIITIIFFVGGIIISCIPTKYFLINMRNNLQFGNIFIYHLNDFGKINIKWIISSILFASCVILSIVIIILYELKQIFKTINEKNPFDISNPKRVSIIGYCLIVGSVVFNFSEAFIYSLFVDQLNIEEVSIQYSINPSLLFSGILVIVLANIFKYGSFLQNEYDSTL